MGARLKTPQRNGKKLRTAQGGSNSLRADLGRLQAQLDRGPGLLADTDPDLPALPLADEHGRYPAVETARVIIARQLIRSRKAAGWTQAELAARAGVRQETISRIETGKHSPGIRTMAKIDRALKKAGV